MHLAVAEGGLVHRGAAGGAGHERVVALAEGLSHTTLRCLFSVKARAREAGLGWDLVRLSPRGPARRPHARAWAWPFFLGDLRRQH